MRRVILIGSGGAGKSTLAARLGRATGLPVHHLDAHYCRPGWVPTPEAGWDAKIAELAAGPAWIMDGNYGRTMDQRLAACDTVVFMDLPRTLRLARVLRRWLRYRGRTRPDMNGGCHEQITWEFVRWVWRYPRDRRPEPPGRAGPGQARRPPSLPARGGAVPRRRTAGGSTMKR